ncbi:GDSL-type esterase/lipase family protein [Pyruvatibacter mobilis]|jgi:lysophospholipase L1-like esterase|uniref:GDSL-type esterase/lipase family protein n=1 Tax=Pyruvatibacter mobilis TaxID=1712261 RepID=UPI003BA86BEA
MDDRYGREWRRGAIRAVLLAAVLILAVFGFLVYVLLASGEAEYWAGEIAEFERLDVSNPPEAGQIVFAGGGTIRKWETLARDLAPLPVLNRGFGGAHVSHVAAYAPRIILPYGPRAVVISAGADDLADVGGKPADEVEADMAALISILRPAGLGPDDDPQVYVLSIPPQPMRKARWAAFAQANTQLSAMAAATPGVHFIDISTPMLTADGRIDESLFRWDGLTFNDAGYDLIGQLVRARLARDLETFTRAEPPLPAGPALPVAPAP